MKKLIGILLLSFSAGALALAPCTVWQETYTVNGKTYTCVCANCNGNVQCDCQ
jgi:hypothetical protein